jgi:5-methylcytosine-specific restriction protein A
MINLNTHLDTLSTKYGYELYLDEELESGRPEPRVRFRIETDLDTFHLKISRSWKTTKIEFIPGPFGSRIANFLCAQVVDHKSVLSNIFETSPVSISHYSLEIDRKNFQGVEKLDQSPHMLTFEIEVLTSESSIEHGLLNETEAQLLEIATSVFASLLPKPSHQYSNPEEVIGYPEGATSQVLVNKYERDPRNRAAAISIHGYYCLACGFDFEKLYGDLGRDFIIVHHVIPVSQLGADYVINIAKDLITLCANCHAMIHRQDPPLTLDQLKAKLKSRQTD